MPHRHLISLTLAYVFLLAAPAFAGSGAEPKPAELPSSWRGIPLGATKEDVNALIPQAEDGLDVVEYEGEVSRMVRGYGDGATYTEHMVQFFKGKAFAVGHIESLDPKRAQQRLMEYQTLYGPGEGELTADGPGSHSWSDPANGRLLLMVWEWAVAVPGTPQPPMRMFDIVTLLVDATRSAQADHYLKAREAAEARNPTP